MRFVPIKKTEQQSCLMLHRTRHLFIRQQTAVINTIRAHLAEFGIVAPVAHRARLEYRKTKSQHIETEAPDRLQRNFGRKLGRVAKPDAMVWRTCSMPAAHNDERIPEVTRACLEALGVLLGKLKAQILEFDRQINAWHRSKPAVASTNSPASVLH
jgi:transposase